MRILHTSDWHLGRQFHQISLLEDQRFVLDQIVAAATEHSVDVVLIAGDIYDRSVPSAEAVLLLDEVIDALNRRLGVPIILIAGNHDSPERLGFAARQLAHAGVHIRGTLTADLQPVVLSDPHGEVAFYGLPYADPARVRDVLEVDVHSHEAATEALVARVRAHNTAGRRSVVLAHCFLSGGVASDSERPLSVGGVEQVSPRHFAAFDYAALGHLHGPQHRGADHVRYSGSILKYSFSEEKQQKSVTLVDLGGDGHAVIEQIPLTPLRDTRVIEGELDDLLERGNDDPHRDDYLLVRLLDKHAILDVMGKLRAVHPNVLHVERPALTAGGERRQLARDQLARGHLPMFRDFYRQMTGEEIDADDEQFIAGILDGINREAG